MRLLSADETTDASGFRHKAPGDEGPAAAPAPAASPRPQVSHDRWVVNKLRALCTYYTKGFEGGAQFRIGVNAAKSIGEVEALIGQFFLA